MSRFTEASKEEVTKQYLHLFSGPDVAAAREIPIAAMILDSSGTVVYCHADAARLFHASPSTLVGQHVSELIPDLPFDRRTPGYNLAYATFWAPEGPPRGFAGVDGQGRSFGLQLALDRLQLQKHQQILLGLRLQAEFAHLPESCAGCAGDVELRADRAAQPAFAA